MLKSTYTDEPVKLKRQDRMVVWVFFRIVQVGEEEISKFVCLLHVKSLSLFFIS